MSPGSQPAARTSTEPTAACCQVCGESLDSGRPVVRCLYCGTPHHRDCWNFVGTCSTFACGAPVGAYDEGLEPPPGEDVHDEILVIDETTPAPPCATVTLRAPARPRAFLVDVAGNRLETSTPTTRLDLDTPLETFLQAAPVLLMTSTFVLGFLIFLWPLATLLLLMRLVVDCTYVIDNVRRELWYVTTVFGHRTRNFVCSFDEIESIGVSGVSAESKSGTSWTYTVVAQLSTAVRIQLSDPTTDYRRAAGYARHLADHMGCNYAETQPGTSGIRPAGGRLLIDAKPLVDDDAPVLARVGRAWWVALAVSMAGNLLLLVLLFK